MTYLTQGNSFRIPSRDSLSQDIRVSSILQTPDNTPERNTLSDKMSLSPGCPGTLVIISDCFTTNITRMVFSGLDEQKYKVRVRDEVKLYLVFTYFRGSGKSVGSISYCLVLFAIIYIVRSHLVLLR